MAAIIPIPFQEKVTTRTRTGTSGELVTVEELRPHPFLAGPENHVICSAIYDILQDTPNPFLMYFFATPGFGKTHLAEGAILFWLMRHPDKTGKCLPAHQFAREWANAQRLKKPQDFFAEYNTLDFFILEDIQDLVTHTSTQKQLVQTLDLLTRHGTRILLTGNQPLSSIPFEPQLTSRLHQGVAIRIQLPDIPTRSAILRLPEHSASVPISDVALGEFVELADREELSVGEMLQRFHKMEWLRKANRETEILPENVPEVFSESRGNSGDLGNHEVREITIPQIAKLAAKFYHVKLSDLRSRSRKTTLVTVRSIIYYMARRLTAATLDEIGLYFNGRDHSTIIHGCTQAELLIQNDEEVRRCVQYLYSELRMGEPRSAKRI